MEKLNLSIDNQLSLLIQYSLTPEELFVVDLLFLASIEENKPEFLVKYYNSSITKTDLRTVLTSLQNKGIILKQYKIPDKGATFDPEAVLFNKNFLTNYRKYSGELAYEFYQHYPSVGIINGLEYDLKNWAKKFTTEEDFYYAYGKAIGWKLEKHKEIIDLLEWGKLNNSNLLNRNIAEFVISKGWERLKEVKDGNINCMSFDNTISI